MCDHVVRIPMARGIDSLNVAHACGIALYELTARDFSEKELLL
ncbi:MAG: TrmH family RNA methyltransferase [Eubacteriales bacterium]